MTKKWFGINLLLLAIAISLGWYVRAEINGFKNKNNLDSIQPKLENTSATAPDKDLPPLKQSKIYDPEEYYEIVDNMVFSENRRNEEKPQGSEQAKEAPPLTQKPILVGTIISDSKKLALIEDPTPPQGNQRPAQNARQRGSTQDSRQRGSTQDSRQRGSAQAFNQGDIQALAQMFGRGNTRDPAQAFNPADIQALAQAFGRGGMGITQGFNPEDMQRLIQSARDQGGLRGLTQAMRPEDIQGLIQMVRQGGTQELAQAFRQGGIQGLARAVDRVNQNSGRRVQVKRIGDTYEGYTITDITPESIVLESNSRKEIIPLHEGSKQSTEAKTAIVATQVVTFGQNTGASGNRASPTGGTRSQPVTVTQPNNPQTSGRQGRPTTATMPQSPPPGSQQRSSNFRGTPSSGQNVIRTPFGDITRSN
jgi:hypothetical protein